MLGLILDNLIPIAMTSGGDMQIIRETYHFMVKEYTRTKKPISKITVFHFIQERAPSYSVFKILSSMEQAGAIETVIDDRKGDWYRPIVDFK